MEIKNYPKKGNQIVLPSPEDPTQKVIVMDMHNDPQWAIERLKELSDKNYFFTTSIDSWDEFVDSASTEQKQQFFLLKGTLHISQSMFGESREPKPLFPPTMTTNLLPPNYNIEPTALSGAL